MSSSSILYRNFRSGCWRWGARGEIGATYFFGAGGAFSSTSKKIEKIGDGVIPWNWTWEITKTRCITEYLYQRQGGWRWPAISSKFTSHIWAVERRWKVRSPQIRSPQTNLSLIRSPLPTIHDSPIRPATPTLQTANNLQRAPNRRRKRRQSPVTIDTTCDWKEDPDSGTFKPKRFKFTGAEKINYAKKPTSAWDYVELLFSNELLQNVCDWWTNNRAKIRRDVNKNSKMLQSWKNVTVEELKTFIGLVLLMGNMKMPSLKLYWSKNQLYHHPIFSKVMSRDRFTAILSCLCFYDENTDTTERMHKVKNFVVEILKNIHDYVRYRQRQEKIWVRLRYF